MRPRDRPRGQFWMNPEPRLCPRTQRRCASRITPWTSVRSVSLIPACFNFPFVVHVSIPIHLFKVRSLGPESTATHLWTLSAFRDDP